MKFKRIDIEYNDKVAESFVGDVDVSQNDVNLTVSYEKRTFEGHPWNDFPMTVEEDHLRFECILHKYSEEHDGEFATLRMYPVSVEKLNYRVFRLPVLMEDEGRHHFIAATRTRDEAEAVIARQTWAPPGTQSYFTPGDFEIVEVSE